MRLQLEIPLDPEQEELLKEVLGIAGDEDALKTHLKGHFTAACHEVVDHYCGKRVLRRAGDFLETKLLLLVKHAFNQTLPDEDQVSRLFQLTTGESRSLLRALMAKYKGELRSGLSNTIKALLEQATDWNLEEAGYYELRTTNQALVAEMNRQLIAVSEQREADATINPPHQPVRRKINSLNTYIIYPAALDELRRLHSLQPLAL